jgi:hypothetical protein
MPSLDVSELNIVIAVVGFFILSYGFLSVKIKQVWYLGEARKCPRHRRPALLTVTELSQSQPWRLASS